jgi:NUMOD3 motif
MKEGKKKHSKETKRKMSAALKANPPNKGKHWSQEVREKIIQEPLT